jgi:pentatricopeptide repeat protein
MRKRNYTALVLKWYSSQSQSHSSAHHHRRVQSFAIPSPVQTECSVKKGEDHSMYSNSAQFIASDRKTQLTTETQEAISPSKPVTGIDDHLTDYDKLCGVFLQKLKGKAAVEAALSQTGVSLKRETIETIVKKASLSGQALLTFFRWAGKQPNCQHDLEAYHTMISALGRRKYFDHVEELLHRMKTGGPSPTMKTLGIVISRYVKATQITKAVQTFDRMEEFGLKTDAQALNTLLHSLCRENHTRSAHSLFKTMVERITPDNITYSILIGGWSKQGNMREVYKTLNEMTGQGIEPDCITYNYVLDGLCRAGRIEDAARLLDSMVGKGCMPTTINYNTMINNLCLVGDLEEGLKCYEEMLARGCKPNITTYSLLIRFHLKARRVADALETFDGMLEDGFVPEVGTVNSFIEPLCKFGPPHAALQFYKGMKRAGCDPNLKTYKLLLMRLGRFGHWGRMSELWKEMQNSGWTSDLEVYTYVVNGFCNGGRLDQACRIMTEALCKGFCPGRIICSKLTNKLLRARKVDMAYGLFLKIKDARRNDKIGRIWRSKGWQY